MKLLVTGGLGFIGSNFIVRVLKNYEDYSVVNIDAELDGSNHENLTEIKKYKNYQFVKGNIIDHDLMNRLVSNCDVVINFAAESHVDRSIIDPLPFVESNFFGVFRILQNIKKYKKRFIQISTDEVFGSLDHGSATEESRLNPSSPYSATKASAELLINSFFVSYNCDCMITRCTNNYGPNQYPEKLIPKTIVLAHQNKKIPLYGVGNSVRDWIFVEDHCDAIMRVLQNGKSGKSYNISASNELDNITIVKKILDKMNKPESLIEFVEQRPGEDHRYSLNSSKIRNELGWSVKTGFDYGLEKTINWYLDNKKWWNNVPSTALAQPVWKNS